MPRGGNPSSGRTIAERIAYYSRSDGGCHVWTGSTNNDGYAHLHINGRTRRLSRLLWEGAQGPIPQGLEVMHSCDKPACIDLRHFSLGTHAENMADMRKRDRHVPHLGEQNARAKLTAENVRAIRGDSRPCPAIAADYGIARTTAWQIKTGRAWAHLP